MTSTAGVELDLGGPQSSASFSRDTNEPFSDIVVPPSDYNASAYLEPQNSRPNSSSSSHQQRFSGKVPTQHDSGVVEDLPEFNQRSNSRFSSPKSSSTTPTSPFGPFGFSVANGAIPDFKNQNHHHSNHQPIRPAVNKLENIPEADMAMRSKRPDSLATRGHEYEELPTSRQELASNYSEVDPNEFNKPRFFNSMSSPASNGPRSLPPMLHKLQQQPSIAPSVQTTDSNDNLLFNSTPQLPSYRKRQNPIYDSTDHEEEKSMKQQTYSKSHGVNSTCICLWWTMLLLTLIISLAAFCLSLYNYTEWGKASDTDGIKTAMLISPSINNATINDIVAQLNLLQEENRQLQSKVDEVSTELAQVKTNMSVNFINVKSRIDNIELTPGPQGPAGVPGAGNLTRCVHDKKSAGGLKTDEVTETVFNPSSLAESQEFVIMGIECTTEGGLYANLIVETVRDPTEYMRYKCKCAGSDSNTSSQSRFCEMHFWRCPKIS